MTLVEFLQYVTQDWKENELLEIRCTPVKQYSTYSILETFAKRYGVYKNEKASLFFSKSQTHLVEELLSFADSHLRNHEKVCYSLNPRVQKNGEILTSGLEYMENVYVLAFDVEEKDKSGPSETYEKALHKYTYNLKEMLSKSFSLTSATVVFSGRGYHLLYKIKRTRITEQRKEWWKTFVKNLKLRTETDLFSIDEAVKDFSRVLGLPSTTNLKWNTNVELRELGQTNESFKIKSEKKFVFKSQTFPKKYEGKFEESLEWRVLTNYPPLGEIYTKVLYATRILARDCGIELKAYNTILYYIYTGVWSTVPKLIYPKEDHTYTKGIILNWCRAHVDWIKENEKVLQLTESEKELIYKDKE